MNTTHNTNYIYGAYVRKSSESEDKQVQSIERQSDDLLKIIQNDHLACYGDIIEETKSAHHPGRTYFQKLISLTEKGYINAWLCWHANRLARNPIDSGMIIYLMDIGKLDHIRTPSRIYYNTPSDKMMLQFEFAMSKKDSDDKGLFVKSGLKKRYEKGFPCGKAPIGYLNNFAREKGNRDWLTDTEKFEKLKLLFARFLKGNDSLNSITEYAQKTLLLKTPLTKRQGGKVVGRSLVSHILKNPIYAGFFYSPDESGGGKTLRKLHQSVPRIITEDEHIRILNIFGEKSHPKMQSHFTAYSGHLFGKDGNYMGADVKYQLICDCGKKFAHRSKEVCPACLKKIQAIKNPRYLNYTYYYNVKRRKTKGLTAKGIEEKKIDTLLCSLFEKEIKISKEFHLWIKKHIDILKDEKLKEVKELVSLHQKELKSIETKKSKLRKLFMEEFISESEFQSEIKELQQQEQTITNTKEIQKDWYTILNSAFDTTLNLDDILNKGNYQEKNKAISLVCSNLIWDEQNLFINKPKWLKEYIKGRKILLSQYPQFEPKNNLLNKGKNTRLPVFCPTLLQWLDDVRKSL